MNDTRELGPWLPDPIPSEDHPEWDRRTARILAAAEPELIRMFGPARTVGPPATVTEAWLSEIGGWWRHGAALAAAAVGFLLLVTEPPRPSPNANEAEAMALTILASDGDPTAIWTAWGVAADPVLALLTLKDHSTFGVSPDTTTGGTPR